MGVCGEEKRKKTEKQEINEKSTNQINQNNSNNPIKPNVNSTIIWIDPDVDSKENASYINKLTLDLIKPKTFKNIAETINHIKSLKFEEIKIIVSGSLYSGFIQSFKNNIRNMYIAPKIIVFSTNESNFYKNSIGYNNAEIFYKYGGLTSDFSKVKNFLVKETPKIAINISLGQESNRANEVQLTFEYIDKKEKLMLPLFFKSLISDVDKENLENYTYTLYNTYSDENKKIKQLLGSIISMKKIPIEILSKYYLRLYTLDSKFYKNLNKDLGVNKINDYKTFIKVIYKGLKLKSFPIAINKILYRGSKISNDEIEKINNHLKKKIPDLPGSIVYSRSFLSFSKERNIAEKFLKGPNIENLNKVLYVLENDSELDYNLATHGDIENISFYPKEKEVLFFPFSSFEIKSINKININNENIYEIKLKYIGKYLHDIEGDEKIISEENKIPDSEFKTQLILNGLIDKEIIMNLNTQLLYNNYQKYKSEIINNHNNNPFPGKGNLQAENINELEMSNQINNEGDENDIFGLKNLNDFLNESKNMENKEKKDNKLPVQNQP